MRFNSFQFFDEFRILQIILWKFDEFHIRRSVDWDFVQRSRWRPATRSSSGLAFPGLPSVGAAHRE